MRDKSVTNIEVHRFDSHNEKNNNKKKNEKKLEEERKTIFVDVIEA